MDQTLKKQMTQTMMLAGDFRTASKKLPCNAMLQCVLISINISKTFCQFLKLGSGLA